MRRVVSREARREARGLLAVAEDERLRGNGGASMIGRHADEDL